LSDSTLAPASSTIEPKRRKVRKRPPRDWSAYDKAQVDSARLTLWLDKRLFAKPRPNGQRGRDELYSDELCLAALALKRLLHLPYRKLEGLVQSFAELSGYSGPTPDYSSLCRRAETLELPPLPRLSPGAQLLLDSSGLRVFGPGEWRRHEHEAKRNWLKIHLAQDGAGQIVDFSLSETSGYGSGDSEAGRRLLAALAERGAEPETVYGDGAYDTGPVRKAAHALGARAVIPPKRTAKIYGGPRRRKPLEEWERERNQQVRACRADRKRWKRDSGYHARSKAESGFSRWKSLLGPSLASRTPERQQVEAAVSVWLLNKLAAAAPI